MNLLEILSKKAQGLSRDTNVRVIGIDLGTTNSTVAQIQFPLAQDLPPLDLCDCVPIVQMTSSGPVTTPLVPSVIAQTKDGQTWIGEGAKRLRIAAREHGLILEKNLFYETKNDMGLKKTYYRADEDLNHARKIAGRLLKFLYDGTKADNAAPLARTVVTVPASFQINQRADTLHGARLAGLELTQFDLLDEPVAALLDYLFTYADDVVLDGPTNVLVFDFGGGTCDVYVAKVTPNHEGLNIETLSVSRYHRLGGGDLDAAIVHEVLLPRLLKENGLDTRRFGWDEKKKVLEPQLLGTAEALKQGICREIERMEKFGRYSEANKEEISVKQPPTVCKIGKEQFILKDPALTAAEWERILEPFLDPDALFVRETEYRTTLSIFAPVLDAVSRSGLEDFQIDKILLAGGSSQISHVRHALAERFKEAEILAFPDSMAAHTAIARGAAWHALWLQITGQPLIHPVVSESIALLTGGGEPSVLIESGEAIPFPNNGDWALCEGLRVPKNIREGLHVKIVGWPSKQVVLELPIKLDQRHAGEPLSFRYRFSAARELFVEVSLKNNSDVRFEAVAENPLTNVVSPSALRMEIEEIEEYLRERDGGTTEDREKFMRLAELYAELRFIEKAVVVLRGLQAKLLRPDPYVLNRMAMLYDQHGDYNRMEKHYREAAAASRHWAGPLFNLALHFERKKRYSEALDVIDEAIAKSSESGPYYVLRSRCLTGLKRGEEAVETLETAEPFFDDPSEMDDWELSWYQSWATFLNKSEELEEAKAEQQRRKSSGRKSNLGENFQLPVKGTDDLN